MKKIVMILAMVLSGLVAYAQQGAGNHSRFDASDFKARMERTIKEAAGFTDEEAARFFPLFHELHDKQRQLNHEAMQLKRDTKGEAGNEAVAKAIKRINAIKVETARLDESYYDNMCKVVPAIKILKAMRAEDKFHRDMLKRMSEREGKKRPGNGVGKAQSKKR